MSAPQHDLGDDYAAARATLLGCGLVDTIGIAGSRGIAASWQDLGVAPPGGPSTMKRVFDKADATFRRLDLPGRALVLACEAAGVDALLDEAARNETAICIETDVGSLATDLSFATSLGDEVVHAGIFPYSLTSTCLGEVALRYKLRGPTVSISVDRERRSAALREALRLLAAGECDHVLTGTVDALQDEACGHPSTIRAIVALLGRADADTAGDVIWPAAGVDAFAGFAARHR